MDFTGLAKQILSLVDQLTKQSRSATINQIVDILKGSKQKAIKDAGHDQLEQFNIAEEVSRTSKGASLIFKSSHKANRLPTARKVTLLSSL